MEIFLYIIIIIFQISLMVMYTSNFKRIRDIDITIDFYRRKFTTTVDRICEDVDRLEVHVTKISQQIDALPDVVKEDNHRTLLAILERIDAKPITPKNNWESIKEAFKGPVRVEINERN